MRQTLIRFVMRLVRRAHGGWTRLKRPITLGVKAAIYDGDGRVLLVKHSYVGGWHLPGGGVGRDERLVDAVRREVMEELGLSLRGKLPIVGVYFAPHQGKSDHIALFRAHKWEGEVQTNWEIAEAAFFHLHDLPEGTTTATQRRLEELGGIRALSDKW